MRNPMKPLSPLQPTKQQLTLARHRVFGDVICYDFRHFPQVHLHPNAQLASLAVEAARLQDGFWKLHEKFLKTYSPLSSNVIFHIAKDLKLDTKKLLNDMESETLLRHIKNDLLEGKKLGIDTTPTLFVNGQKCSHFPSFEELQQKITALIPNSTQHPHHPLSF